MLITEICGVMKPERKGTMSSVLKEREMTTVSVSGPPNLSTIDSTVEVPFRL